MVAVIIPAYNEGRRIGLVLQAVLDAQLPDEVIVVSDASRDGTAEIARCFPGVRVVELSENQGKGGAMAAGVEATQAEILAFVDADLDGLTGEHVDQIIQPILDGSCDMCIGVFRGGRFWSDSAQRLAPYISGQRALRRELFESTPWVSELRLGVEVALNTVARRTDARVCNVVLRGVSNTFKEQKMGLMKGAAARARMYAEIGRAWMRVRRSTPRGPRRVSGRPS